MNLLSTAMNVILNIRQVWLKQRMDLLLFGNRKDMELMMTEQVFILNYMTSQVI